MDGWMARQRPSWNATNACFPRPFPFSFIIYFFHSLLQPNKFKPRVSRTVLEINVYRRTHAGSCIWRPASWRACNFDLIFAQAARSLRDTDRHAAASHNMASSYQAPSEVSYLQVSHRRSPSNACHHSPCRIGNRHDHLASLTMHDDAQSC